MLDRKRGSFWVPPPGGQLHPVVIPMSGRSTSSRVPIRLSSTKRLLKRYRPEKSMLPNSYHYAPLDFIEAQLQVQVSSKILWYKF